MDMRNLILSLARTERTAGSAAALPSPTNVRNDDALFAFDVGRVVSFVLKKTVPDPPSQFEFISCLLRNIVRYFSAAAGGVQAPSRKFP
jgi:hypothetical protein